jgi:predicted acylesterase/phospholipase RssA
MNMGVNRVLALDGGGIRGLIAARVLEELEMRTEKRITDLFDLIAGTSTGGILALGLTKPDGAGGPEFTATDMRDLYLNEGAKIFPHSLFQDVKTLHGVADARYPAAPIEAILDERFGNTMLSEALKEVVIPSYDLSRPGPFFFKREYANKKEDWNVAMAKVARATSAAPTYFEPAILPSTTGGRDHALVDGGTFANNPTLCGYVDALCRRKEDERIIVLSIGTGQPPRTVGSGPIPIEPGHAAHFGLAKWARPLLEVVLDGVPETVQYQMDAISTAHPRLLTYLRLQSALPTASHALDDASPENCQRLLDDADALIKERSTDITAMCAELV